jgi:signal transduction histidine kinase
MTQPTDDVNVLLVDDLQENLVALEALIRGPGRQVFTARSGEEALSLMIEHAFALAILDVQMPSMNGFELAELMRGTERTRAIPIVFVSAAGRELNYAFQGYESGAVDFLYKPLDPVAVRSKVSVFVELFRQRQELQQAKAQLQRAVSMRDDFMSMIAHELRNPLNSVYLQAQLRRKMLAAPKQPDAQAMLRMVERDERQIRSMVRLLDDMLDVSRARTGKLAIVPAPFDLAASAQVVVEAIQEQAKTSGVAVTLAAPPTLEIVGDEFRIEQVITNLLTNALRYGGGQPVAVTVGVREDVNEAFVSVRDQGMGIAPADQERIFEEFVQLPGATPGGTGLGLPISRRLAELLGGALTVVSEPGDGSTFYVTLPRDGRRSAKDARRATRGAA